MGGCLSCFFSCFSCGAPYSAVTVLRWGGDGRVRCAMCAMVTCRDTEGMVFLFFFSPRSVMDGRGTHSVLELCGQSVVCVAQVARVGVVLCSFNLVFWCSVLQDLRE